MTTTTEIRITLTPEERETITKARAIISEISNIIYREECDGIGDVDFTIITSDQIDTVYSVLDDLNDSGEWYVREGFI